MQSGQSWCSLMRLSSFLPLHPLSLSFIYTRVYKSCIYFDKGKLLIFVEYDGAFQQMSTFFNALISIVIFISSNIGHFFVVKILEVFFLFFFFFFLKDLISQPTISSLSSCFVKFSYFKMYLLTPTCPHPSLLFLLMTVDVSEVYGNSQGSW